MGSERAVGSGGRNVSDCFGWGKGVSSVSHSR